MRKTSILVKLSQKFRLWSKFSKISNIFDFGQIFEEIEFFRKFRKISILVKFSENFDFGPQFSKKFNFFENFEKFQF